MHEYCVRTCIVLKKYENDNIIILTKKCEMIFIRSTLFYDFKSIYNTTMVNYGFSSTIKILTTK